MSAKPLGYQINPKVARHTGAPPPPPRPKCAFQPLAAGKKAAHSETSKGMLMTFESKFSIGDRVNIDGDSSLAAVVTAVCFRQYGGRPAPLFEVSWISQGSNHSAWIEEFRLQETA